jgi:hypothetical protein
MDFYRTEEMSNSAEHHKIAQDPPNQSPKKSEIEILSQEVDDQEGLYRIRVRHRAYSIISRHQHQHPSEPPIAPNFLGHLTENGRVMGLLLEKVNGRFASPDDRSKCEEAIRRLHGMGLIHGDINRYNFLIKSSSTGNVRMVDFEHVEDFDEETAREELEVLPFELAEMSGRAGPTRDIV